MVQLGEKFNLYLQIYKGEHIFQTDFLNKIKSITWRRKQTNLVLFNNAIKFSRRDKWRENEYFHLFYYYQNHKDIQQDWRHLLWRNILPLINLPFQNDIQMNAY